MTLFRPPIILLRIAAKQ